MPQALLAPTPTLGDPLLVYKTAPGDAMCSALELIQQRILPAIRAADPDLAALYGAGGSLDHYDQLARTLDARTADPDLTVAAFLRGVPPARVRDLDGVRPEAVSILEDWQALHRITPSTPAAALAAFQGDARALTLGVYDTLLRIDPSGDFRTWTCTFHLSPRHPRADAIETASFDDAFFQRVEHVLAPLAQAWGLWMEGNVLTNAALLRRDPARFKELVDFVVGEAFVGKNLMKHVEPVREALADVPNTYFRWEWRHLASIAANLETIQPTEWRKSLFRCGFTTVLSELGRCYDLLGRLHAACPYRRQDIRDYLGEPTPGGYRALHTRLTPPEAEGGHLNISVRIVPDKETERRFALIEPDRMAAILRRQTPGRTTIRVYTPAGDVRSLPPGATVLNFAVALHPDFTVHATHAVLNRKREVGLLHVLEDGDEVNVVKGDRPRALPEGWEQAIPGAERERVRGSWQRGWRSALAAEGERWLRKHLSLNGEEADVVQVLVDLAAESFAATSRGSRRNAAGWLTQIAIHFGSLPVPAGAAVAQVDETTAKEMVLRVEETTRALLRTNDCAEVEAPENLRGRVRGIRHCPLCRPGRSRNLVATEVVVDGGVELVLHRPDEDCAQGGVPMALRDRVSLGQFFVVETNNRVGVALQVLSVFEDEGIDLLEVAGRRLGPDWGVIRVEVEPIGPRSIRHIKRRLLDLESVDSVRTPLDAGSALLEAALPPRSDGSRTLFSRPQPYVCGPIAIDDQHFYGREDEISLLFDLLARVQNQAIGRGIMCHVRGPLRIGKSSLVLRFQLLLRRRPELGVVPVYVKAEVGEVWTSLKRRLELELERELAESWRTWREPGSPPKGLGLEETLRLVSSLPRRPAVVLAVDEVNRMFGACAQPGDELIQLLRFRDLAVSIPGLLTLWIGPAAGVGNLHREVREILVASQPLVVRTFTLEQALAMLEARKLSLFHTISLEQNLGRRLFRLTGGEPFWLGHLAQIMWTLRHNTGSRVVRFDQAVAEAAHRELLERHELFAVRVEPRTRARRDAACWSVATLLARDAPGESSRGLTTSDVAERLGLDEARAAQVIETLKDRGALIVHEGEPRRWCIGSPLLSEYLNQHYKHLLTQGTANA